MQPLQLDGAAAALCLHSEGSRQSVGNSRQRAANHGGRGWVELRLIQHWRQPRRALRRVVRARAEEFPLHVVQVFGM